MPSLGADMDEGMVVRWLVSPGDVVHRGDLVAEVETQKGIIEAEIWEDGVVEEFLVELGATVPVGTPLARLGPLSAEEASASVADERESDRAGRPAPTAVATRAKKTPPPPIRHLAHELGVDLDEVNGTGPDGTVTRDDIHAAAKPLARSHDGSVAASPLARAVASELGIDLASIRGSGPHGAVLETDVMAASGTSPAAPPPRLEPEHGEGRTEEQATAMRQAIAKLMARSKREIPHYYLGHQIDVTPALTWLEQRNAERPVADRVLPAVLLLKTSALATRAVPEVNGFWVNDHLELSDAVHLGVAISLRGGGLIAPAIHDADAKTLDELMAALRDLVKRTRSGKLRSSEMSAPTITVTNLGDQGVEAVYGVIYPPQVALVGFGRIVERAWAHEGMVGARSIVTATLAADHRAGDGHTGGLYLAEIERLLQKPEEL